TLWPGQDDGERQILVVRVHQDAEQVEELLGRASATGENDDAVADAYKGLKALLYVREDHQFVDDRVRRFGSDDSRFRQAQVTAADHPLLGVGDSRALHRPFHHARPATGADIQAAQAEFVPDLLGVLVLLGVDRMAAPTHHYFRFHPGAQGARVAQQVEDVIGDPLGTAQV